MSDPVNVAEALDLTNFYWAIGAMIVMNFGTILSIGYSAFRAMWWISKLDSRVSSNSKDIDAAHSAIRILNGKK